jgi:hypothetical protein
VRGKGYLESSPLLAVPLDSISPILALFFFPIYINIMEASESVIYPRFFFGCSLVFFFFVNCSYKPDSLYHLASVNFFVSFISLFYQISCRAFVFFLFLFFFCY